MVSSSTNEGRIVTIAFPGESADYRAARDRLLEQEIELRRATSLPRLFTFAEERGWRRLRLLSSAANTYNRDYHGETAEGFQRPMLNVFHRDGDTIRHFWGSELLYAPTDADQEPRHVGTLEPLWNLFDLTLEGRPSDWYEQLRY